MKHFNVEQLSVYGILETKDSYEIPTYQRLYSWGELEVDQYLKDILKFKETRSETQIYFLGNIIVKSDFEGGRTNSEIVDGQQRITTNLLFAKAILDVSKKFIYEKEWTDSVNDFFFSGRRREEKKLKLNNMPDQDVLEKILTKHFDEINFNDFADNSYWLNYKLIVDKLETIIKSESDYTEMMDLLEYIMMAEIIMGEENISGDVFENINSKGKPLSVLDLVKNRMLYLSSFFSEEEKNILVLFDDTLHSYFNRRDNKNPKGEINRFFRLINIIRDREISDLDTKTVYDKIRDSLLTIEENKDKKKFKETINEYKKIFEFFKFVEGIVSSEEIIDESFAKLKLLYSKTKPSYFPVLFELYKKSNYDLKSKDFKDSISIIEKFVVNEQISSLISYNKLKFTPELSKLISKVGFSEIEQTVTNYAYSKGIRIPDEKLLKEKIKDLNLYERPALAKYMLSMLEKNMGTSAEKDFNVLQRLTIEHVMPQDVLGSSDNSKKWREVLGEDLEKHSAHLNKIGNLTFLPQTENSTLGNKVFKDKLSVIKSSTLNLNSDIKSSKEWNIKIIKRRTEKLSKLAATIWSWNLKPTNR